jgi:hypothetical protein
MEACQRCLRLGKLCFPRAQAAFSGPPGDTREAGAMQWQESALVDSPTANRNRTEKLRPPALTLDTAEALLNLDVAYGAYGPDVAPRRKQSLKVLNGDRVGTLENGETKNQLAELMGYNSKSQRPEYMKSRRLARKTALPLCLDRAWRLYSKNERNDAVARVFRAFESR